MKLRVKLAKLGLKLLHRYWKPGVLKVQGLTIKRCPQVFIPGRLTMTSLLLAEALDVREGFEVLDVGCGSGILSLVAARRARRVVAVDINPKALQCTIYNAKVNGLEGKIEARLGSLFQPLKPGEKFDLIVANLPYLPGRPQSLLEAGWLDDGSL
ncbi:MAG: tRNA (adenine(22)-N(1))-methyltransferase TrmK, partial [Candidatus Hecatellaceae archaeon]